MKKFNVDWITYIFDQAEEIINKPFLLYNNPTSSTLYIYKGQKFSDIISRQIYIFESHDPGILGCRLTIGVLNETFSGGWKRISDNEMMAYL